MTELDITDFFFHGDPKSCFNSVANLGPDAAAITWGNALDAARKYTLLVTGEQVEAAIQYFVGFGAWSEEELRAMPLEELNALMIQDVSSEVREFRELAGGDWDKWRRLCEGGDFGGSLFPGDVLMYGEVVKVYYSLG